MVPNNKFDWIESVEQEPQQQNSRLLELNIGNRMMNQIQEKREEQKQIQDADNISQESIENIDVEELPIKRSEINFQESKKNENLKNTNKNQSLSSKMKMYVFDTKNNHKAMKKVLNQTVKVEISGIMDKEDSFNLARHPNSQNEFIRDQ